MKHLERAFIGPNNFWRYLIMLLTVFIGGNMVGTIVVAATVIVKNGFQLNIESMFDILNSGLSSWVIFALLLFTFAAMCVVFALLIKPLHQRSLKGVINGRKHIRWNRVWVGIIVWGILNAVSLLVDVLWLDPENYRLQFNLATFIPLVFVVLLLLPFQTTFEELIFRGYLSQGVAVWTKNRWVTLVVISTVFGLMHAANPEIKEYGFALMMPQYIIMGLMLGLISILDDGIELAIGVHFVNNAFAALFVTHSSSAFQTDAVYEVMEIDPVESLNLLLILSVIAFFMFWRIYKWDFGVLNKKVQHEQPSAGVDETILSNNSFRN